MGLRRAHDIADESLIELRSETLEHDNLGVVTGEVFFRRGLESFPDEHWNDFVVVVLGWWCPRIAQLLRGDLGVELEFMDGPFKMSVERVERNTLQLIGWRYGSRRFNGSCAIEVLSRDTVVAAERVLAYCDDNAIVNDDVRVLRHGAHELATATS